MEIIFDFDGTIADSFDFNIKIFNNIKDKFGFKEIDENEVQIFRDEGFKQVMKDIELSYSDLPEIIERHQQISNAEVDKLKSFPGIFKVLSELKKEGFSLGLLNSNSKENVEKFLSKNKIDGFDYVEGGGDLFGKDKVIKKVLKKRRLKKEEVIYIGDEIRDVEACKKVGVKIISVTWGYNSKKALKKVSPDFIVDKPLEILDVLIQNNGK